MDAVVEELFFRMVVSERKSKIAGTQLPRM
jgi:hypothetical protein